MNTYAPIIIPTLNRIDHLKRLVDSLLKNEDAKYTDLYISVDYPPSDKYIEGHEKVCNYVRTICGFAYIDITIQDENLGPGGNALFLIKKISAKYDKYIFTEDDNVFSGNALKFLNWGLETFKSDDCVFSICGLLDVDVKIKDSDYFFTSLSNAYGAGHWIAKDDACIKWLNEENLEKIYYSKELQKKLREERPYLYWMMAHDILRRISDMRNNHDVPTFIDIWQNIYCIENDLLCVKPTLSKVVNVGNDGSGVHGLDNYRTIGSELDSSVGWGEIPKRATFSWSDANRMYNIQNKEVNSRNIFVSRLIFEVNRILGNRLLLRIYNMFFCAESQKHLY